MNDNNIKHVFTMICKIQIIVILLFYHLLSILIFSLSILLIYEHATMMVSCRMLLIVVLSSVLAVIYSMSLSSLYRIFKIHCIFTIWPLTIVLSSAISFFILIALPSWDFICHHLLAQYSNNPFKYINKLLQSI